MAFDELVNVIVLMLEIMLEEYDSDYPIPQRLIMSS